MGRIEEALRKAKANRRTVVPNQPISSLSKVDSGQNRLAPKADLHDVSDSPAVSPKHFAAFNNAMLREERVIAASDQDDRVGPYRQLRTQLLKMMQDQHWATLAITSATENAGKSLTAANLAISLSRVAGTTVLLVDLDLKTPTIHKKLNLTPEKGLVDYLGGMAELEDILFDPGIDNLTVLVGRPAGRNSSELLASPKMDALMRGLCQNVDGNLTIFDLPPLLRNDDAILFAPHADATLIVVEDGVTTEDELNRSIRLLSKANFVGTVFNKALS